MYIHLCICMYNYDIVNTLLQYVYISYSLYIHIGVVYVYSIIMDRLSIIGSLEHLLERRLCTSHPHNVLL